MTETQSERLKVLRKMWEDAQEKWRQNRTPTNQTMPELARQELQSLSKMEKAEKREQLGAELYDWTVSLLYRHDPIKLVPMDCPKNEYEIEARMLLERLIGGTWTVDQIQTIAWNIFREMFDVSRNDKVHRISGPYEDYRGIAEELHAKLAAN